MNGGIIECGHVDPQLLFQRLVIVAKGSTEDMVSIFRYELSVFYKRTNKETSVGECYLQGMKCSFFYRVDRQCYTLSMEEFYFNVSHGKVE